LNVVQVCAEASETSDRLILHIARNKSIIIVHNEVIRMFVDTFGRCNAANIFNYPLMRLLIISAVCTGLYLLQGLQLQIRTHWARS
jgi:hypothetical protein